MDLDPPTSVGIVGGGLAAFTAVATLRQRGYAGRLLLVTDEPHPPYDRPPLSKEVLLGADPGARTRLLTEDRAAELDVELVLGDPVVELDASGGRLVLGSGRGLAVDRVLLSTGGRARTLAVPGGDLPQVSGLRTLEDAERLRSLLVPGAPVVVVGAGFIGLEVAAAARTLGCEVTVVEAAERVLGRVVPAAVAEHVAQVHEESGVRLLTGVGVAAVEGATHVTGVLLSDGRRLPASCVVVGIGMVPADELARRAGLAVGDGVLTDGSATTSNPAVLAAGDVACSPDPWVGARVRIEQWQSAQSRGAAAAHTMLGLEAPAPPVPWFWSDQGELRLQTAGTPRPEHRVVERGAGGPEGRTWFHLDEDGRLAAAVALQRVRDVRGAIALIQSGVAVDEELLADESQDLRRLAKALVAARG